MTHQVLLVEDDRVIQLMLSELLRSMGYAVTIAQDVTQAQTQLQSASLDLLLLDMVLPDGNGLDILAQVQQMSDPPLVHWLQVKVFGRLSRAICTFRAAE